mmetsp:Transcript_71628/g.191076  ORF Transcript_71628/g.191076 Transcript_71628/m.191076 type:complete len:345 (-) Transcript_71628:51-1085(-)
MQGGTPGHARTQGTGAGAPGEPVGSCARRQGYSYSSSSQVTSSHSSRAAMTSQMYSSTADPGTRAISAVSSPIAAINDRHRSVPVSLENTMDSSTSSGKFTAQHSWSRRCCASCLFVQAKLGKHLGLATLCMLSLVRALSLRLLSLLPAALNPKPTRPWITAWACSGDLWRTDWVGASPRNSWAREAATVSAFWFSNTTRHFALLSLLGHLATSATHRPNSDMGWEISTVPALISAGDVTILHPRRQSCPSTGAASNSNEEAYCRASRKNFTASRQSSAPLTEGHRRLSAAVSRWQLGDPRMGSYTSPRKALLINFDEVSPSAYQAVSNTRRPGFRSKYRQARQ